MDRQVDEEGRRMVPRRRARQGLEANARRRRGRVLPPAPRPVERDHHHNRSQPAAPVVALRSVGRLRPGEPVGGHAHRRVVDRRHTEGGEALREAGGGGRAQGPSRRTPRPRLHTPSPRPRLLPPPPCRPRVLTPPPPQPPSAPSRPRRSRLPSRRSASTPTRAPSSATSSSPACEWRRPRWRRV